MARLAIAIEDIHAAALIFGGFNATFSVSEFTEFLKSQASDLEAEDVDEALAELAGAGKLRQIGPGIYAKPSA
jgi:hypothetical protein